MQGERTPLLQALQRTAIELDCSISTNITFKGDRTFLYAIHGKVKCSISTLWRLKFLVLENSAKTSLTVMNYHEIVLYKHMNFTSEDR